MPSESSIFDKKPVFDWNHVPVGHVEGAQRDPKTRDTRRLVLTLTPEAQQELGTQELTMELPASMIFGMRRDGVTLDRPISEIRRSHEFASMLKQ